MNFSKCHSNILAYYVFSNSHTIRKKQKRRCYVIKVVVELLSTFPCMMRGLISNHEVCYSVFTQKLLQMHSPRMQCEEAGAEAFEGRRRCGDDL